jgi:hypothetical protein
VVFFAVALAFFMIFLALRAGAATSGLS